MNLWIDTKEHAQHDWLRQWLWVTTTAMAIGMVKKQQHTPDPVTTISVSAAMAEEFLSLLADNGGRYEVYVHGGEPSDKVRGIISANHWDKKPMDQRTAEVIMVLKGNHNLHDDLPDKIPDLDTYLTDLALYMSDDCMCPFSTYVKDPKILDGVIRNAVLDYMRACDNAPFVVWAYFEAKRLMGDLFSDTQFWCMALTQVDVRDNGKYVNGFTEQNTQPYQRQRPFEP